MKAWRPDDMNMNWMTFDQWTLLGASPEQRLAALAAACVAQ
jgi:hypothetical protein